MSKDIISMIEAVCDIDKLTVRECGEAIGYFKYMATQITLRELENKPQNKPNPNITMINCRAK